MDFAQLGIRLDTGDINSGIQQLKKISPAAKVASQASASMGLAMRNASVIFAKSTELMVRGMLALAQANGNASKSTLKNLRELANQSRELTKAANSQQVLANSIEQTTTAVQKQTVALKAAMTTTNAFNAVSGRTGRGRSMSGNFRFSGMTPGGGFAGPSPSRDLAPNRFNTANIAAQFQDIGVTAAMGMNPLTIALQQGTQLSAILNTMESPLKGIAVAFRQIINPVSLISIGLTALLVVGVQVVDWSKVASSSLMFLADSLDVLIAGLVALSAAMIAVKWSSITTAIAGLIPMIGAAATAVWGFTAALLANPITWIVVAITGATAALLKFSGVTDGLKEKLRSLAQGNNNVTDSVSEMKDKYAELREEILLNIDALIAEQDALSMGSREGAIMLENQKLLARIKRENLDLSKEQVTDLLVLNEQFVDQKIKLDQLQETYKLLRDTGKGFFTDLKDGLTEGKSLWESFSDAAVNALNRIADAFFEQSLNMVFDNIGGGGGSSGGSFLATAASWLFNAKGNAFSPSGVEKFAKGGSFTNSVVSSPTMFTFANGGKFGVMGEAGPEAILPLQRGSDGSLGVKAHGGMSGGNVVVNVINNSNVSARQETRKTGSGTEIDVIIDEIVASKLSSQGTASERALNERNDRQLIRRR